MKSIVVRAALVAAVVGVCAGCESLAYQGWSPSARTMRDNPGFDDVYWGANAEFHVLDKDQEGRRQRTASASAGGEDFGIHHERLTYKFQGRDYRLTDVHGNVVKALLA